MAPKTPAKKAGGYKGADDKQRSKVRVAKDKVVFSLSPADARKMAQCLEKGEIKLKFKEVRATRLPHTLDDGVLID